MEWFDGNVNDALNNYQQKQGILVVYVYAENDQNSNKFDELWNSFDIKTIINQTSYIAIRLLKDSEGAQQFAQFFPTLTIPVCYILGLNAQPLEVITALQELSPNQLNASFAKALSLYNEQLKEYGISKSNEIEEEKMTETMAPDSTSTDPNAETANEVESEATKGMTKEEKLAYYRKLIEDKKNADDKKEKEEERRKEIQRRNEGKAMAEIRDKLRDKELKESAEARRKQKEEDAAVLKRLREQLKADKEERAKRNKGEVSGEPKEAEKAATSEAINKPINTDECRIQCKFPDGSTLNLSLPSKEPLQVVYDAVTMDSRKPENFFFVQPYPRKKLTEMNKSLLAHGLTPSSVILVIANENPRARNYALVGTGYLNMLLGFIYVPFVAIYQFFMSFTNRASSNNKKQPKKANKEAEAKTGKTLKDGNFQRLNNDESDHSDNEATWNGNSTQQL